MNNHQPSINIMNRFCESKWVIVLSFFSVQHAHTQSHAARSHSETVQAECVRLTSSVWPKWWLDWFCFKLDLGLQTTNLHRPISPPIFQRNTPARHRHDTVLRAALLHSAQCSWKSTRKQQMTVVPLSSVYQKHFGFQWSNILPAILHPRYWCTMIHEYWLLINSMHLDWVIRIRVDAGSLYKPEL